MARLKAIVARIQLFYSPTREPLRRTVYTTLVAILGIAVTAGILTGALAATLTGIGATVLMVPAVEAARRLVTPVKDPIITDEHPGRHEAPSS